MGADDDDDDDDDLDDDCDGDHGSDEMGVKPRAKEGHLDACGRFSTTVMLMYSTTKTSVRGSAKCDQKSMLLK